MFKLPRIYLQSIFFLFSFFFVFSYSQETPPLDNSTPPSGQEAKLDTNTPPKDLNQKPPLPNNPPQEAPLQNPNAPQAPPDQNLPTPPPQNPPQEAPLQNPATPPDQNLPAPPPPSPSAEGNPENPGNIEDPGFLENAKDETDLNPQDAKIKEVAEEGLQETDEGLQDEATDAIKLKIKSIVSPYDYEAAEKDNPFSKPKDIQDEDFETDEEDRAHPLEYDPYDSIELKAIIKDDTNNSFRALFQSKDAGTYTLTKNDRLGIEGAIIHTIDLDKVWVIKREVDPIEGDFVYVPDEKTFDKKDEKDEDPKLYYEILKQQNR